MVKKKQKQKVGLRHSATRKWTIKKGDNKPVKKSKTK